MLASEHESSDWDFIENSWKCVVKIANDRFLGEVEFQELFSRIAKASNAISLEFLISLSLHSVVYFVSAAFGRFLQSPRGNPTMKAEIYARLFWKFHRDYFHSRMEKFFIEICIIFHHLREYNFQFNWCRGVIGWVVMHVVIIILCLEGIPSRVNGDWIVFYIKYARLYVL